MNNKWTKLEKSWVLYDVGNSAFVLLISTIIPIYFNYLAQNGVSVKLMRLPIGDTLPQ